MQIIDQSTSNTSTTAMSSVELEKTQRHHLLETCSLRNWHTDYEKICVQTITLRIPPDVLAYLRADFFILPQECTPAAAVANDTIAGYDNNPPDTTAVESADSTDDEEDDSARVVAPSLAAFSRQISDAIAELGGGCFIKTNWHCPKDSFWITAGQTLRCRDISDVYTLLKASTCCQQDLDVTYACGVEQFLNLRRWLEIHPGTEFRCYVRSRRLFGEFGVERI